MTYCPSPRNELHGVVVHMYATATTTSTTKARSPNRIHAGSFAYSGRRNRRHQTTLSRTAAPIVTITRCGSSAMGMRLQGVPWWTDGTRANAYKPCVWNAGMAYFTGASAASAIATRWEACHPWWDANRLMDLWTN